MAVTNEYKSYILDLVSHIDGVAHRHMFGGVGLFLGGVMFGIITRDDNFYLRTDDLTKGDFESAGSLPLKPRKNNPMIMSYHEVPAYVLEDQDELDIWVSKAWEAAQRNNKNSNRNHQ